MLEARLPFDVIKEKLSKKIRAVAFSVMQYVESNNIRKIVSLRSS